jgi:hypothetical protein
LYIYLFTWLFGVIVICRYVAYKNYFLNKVSTEFDQHLAELIEAGDQETYSLYCYLEYGRIATTVEGLLLCLFIKGVIKLTTNYQGISCLSTPYKILFTLFCQGELHMETKLLVLWNVAF